MDRDVLAKDWMRLAADAVAAGATVTTPGRVDWDISGHCQNPQKVRLFGKVPATHKGMRGNIPKGVLVIMAKCRRCERCLKERSWMWADKARLETEQSERTWFVTLTFKPEQRLVMESVLRLDYSERGEDFDRLNEDERFLAFSAASGDRVQRYVKRLRKGSPDWAEKPIRLRYLAVSEAHKDGFPHWHMLIHEYPEERLQWRRLSREWTALGFAKFNLCGEEAVEARYVCKYLAKSMLARVRASNGYGKKTVFTETFLAKNHTPNPETE